ncbi:MAG: hypothetical protein KGH74_02770 [Candidatus Micrarchaeota archaeon]|nr:hypothetical protein [Candidatus Micrarchaeota archaeon]MDE1824200.1 hypothetical protein [Candidatus Micrarchaeota archaeon]
MMLKLSLAIVGNPEDVTIAQDAVEDRLCGILFAFQDAIGVLTLVLFIGGGAVYAISHLSPNAGNMKGSIQGYSAMMLYGAIIGLVLVLISPYLVDMIVNLVTQSYVTQCIDTDVNDVGI